MISVAMATYNGEKYIKKQLESIYNQTKKADEVIICDDMSTDDTVKIVQKFINDNNLKKSWKIIVNDKNLGYIKNFIKAISLTKGDYIFLSDQDDIFYLNKFEVMVEILKKNPKCILLNGDFENIDENGKKIKSVRTCSRYKRKTGLKKIDFRNWLYQSSFPGFSMCFKSVIREKLIDINLDYCYGHDQLIGLLAISEDGNYITNNILSGYRIHFDNTTGGKNIMNNYSISKRIEVKKKEFFEYEKLRNLIKDNKIHNIDYEFLDLREKELKKRIYYLQKGNILGLVRMLFFSKAYPKNTIIGDCLYLLRGKI